MTETAVCCVKSVYTSNARDIVRRKRSFYSAATKRGRCTSPQSSCNRSHIYNGSWAYEKRWLIQCFGEPQLRSKVNGGHGLYRLPSTAHISDTSPDNAEASLSSMKAQPVTCHGFKISGLEFGHVSCISVLGAPQERDTPKCPSIFERPSTCSPPADVPHSPRVLLWDCEARVI